MKRSSPIRRTPVKKSRAKPRPGRLKGADMARLRLDCFQRDLGQCRECGKVLLYDGALLMHPNRYHMAHITSRGAGGKDELSNVRSLCSGCHYAEHACGPTMQKPVPAKEK